jgi:hypothetical protein
LDEFADLLLQHAWRGKIHARALRLGFLKHALDVCSQHADIHAVFALALRDDSGAGNVGGMRRRRGREAQSCDEAHWKNSQFQKHGRLLPSAPCKRRCMMIR